MSRNNSRILGLLITKFLIFIMKHVFCLESISLQQSNKAMANTSKTDLQDDPSHAVLCIWLPLLLLVKQRLVAGGFMVMEVR